jgi:glycosyltransferase involved in cell wall biosynthesis
LKLLLAISELALGGAEGVVVELAADARRRGDEVVVAAAPGPRADELRRAGAGHVKLPARGRSPRALAGAGRALASAVRGFGPDVVHAHNPKIAAVAAAALRTVPRSRRPALVATYHGVAPGRARAAALMLRGSDSVVAVSRALSAELAANGLPAGVIPNGVPAAEPLTPAERERLDEELGLAGRQVVTAVGRLVPQKAHGRLLEAAAAAARRGIDASFLIVGEGPLRAELEHRAGALGLDGAVRFTGARRDARAIVARSDLVVFSSDWEGLALAAVEALAAGVPVVSTEVAGSEELLSTGAGLVVGRDPESIAEGIAALLADAERRERMGAEGRRLHAERYSSERMTAAYRAVYESARHNVHPGDVNG